MHIFIPTVTLTSWGAYVGVDILSNNVWLKSSGITVISLLVKLLNRWKAKWAAPQWRTSFLCDDCTKSWPWADLELSSIVPVVWIRSGTLPLEIAHSVLHQHKKKTALPWAKVYPSFVQTLQVQYLLKCIFSPWTLRLDAFDIDNAGMKFVFLGKGQTLLCYSLYCAVISTWVSKQRQDRSE